MRPTRPILGLPIRNPDLPPGKVAPLPGPRPTRPGGIAADLLRRPVLANPDRLFGETGARPPQRGGIGADLVNRAARGGAFNRGGGGGAFGGAIPRLLRKVAPSGGPLSAVAPVGRRSSFGGGVFANALRSGSFRRPTGQAEGAR